MKTYIILTCLAFLNIAGLRAEDTNALVNTWLAAQAKIQTWSADLVQTRTMKSFAQPLKAEGHVWFAAPERFHWELTHPSQTIAVRANEEMLVIYPRLKRVEKYPLNVKISGQWKDMMDLLETGFPRDRGELDKRFKIAAINVKDGLCEMVLEPKSSAARKMIPQFKLVFSTKELSLLATEMQFADGSTMRNDFTNPLVNEKQDPELFAPKIGSDYKVVEPLKQK